MKLSNEHLNNSILFSAVIIGCKLENSAIPVSLSCLTIQQECRSQPVFRIARLPRPLI